VILLSPYKILATLLGATIADEDLGLLRIAVRWPIDPQSTSRRALSGRASLIVAALYVLIDDPVGPMWPPSVAECRQRKNAAAHGQKARPVTACVDTDRGLLTTPTVVQNVHSERLCVQPVT